MILITHNNEILIKVVDLDHGQNIVFGNDAILVELNKLAVNYPDSILIWCHEHMADNIDLEWIKDNFTLKNLLLSFSEEHFLPPQIGYVEDSPFLKVNKKVRYPSWQMSSLVGATHASVFLTISSHINDSDFDYALHSIAKLGMPKGLLCYSEPKLLKDGSTIPHSKSASFGQLFKFVRQHYRFRWVFLLLFNVLKYDSKWPFFQLCKSIFYKKRKQELIFKLESLGTPSSRMQSDIDVIIPTIGRKQYLYQVLKDLEEQTLVPKQVIIIEQNPEPQSETELAYLKNEKWSFKIIHKFIHQTGACNARNLGMSFIESSYVFFADDDIRFDTFVLEKAVSKMFNYSFKGITLSCLKPEEIEPYKHDFQWYSFGSGCSIVEATQLKDVKFDMAFEHGYGEDTDFGMQLRQKGVDIIYTPDIKLQHLKAPIGGFRTKFVHPWEAETLLPKPSPTVMLHRMRNTTKQQLLGYKTTLFFKFYNKQSIKNPIKYNTRFKKQWQLSKSWANQITKTAYL